MRSFPRETAQGRHRRLRDRTLYLTVIEEMEEAITNSLFMAETMTGWDDTTIGTLSIERIRSILQEWDVIRMPLEGA